MSIPFFLPAHPSHNIHWTQGPDTKPEKTADNVIMIELQFINTLHAACSAHRFCSQ